MNAPGLSAGVEASVAVLTQDLRLGELFSSTTRSPALLRLGTRGVHGVVGRCEEVSRKVPLGFVGAILTRRRRRGECAKEPTEKVASEFACARGLTENLAS